MYKKYFKRIIGLVFSLISFVILLPLFLVLICLGAIMMRGNPLFIQERPGLNEKRFKLVKFRTMSNQKDAYGKLLPDEVRLNKYGKFLRATSLDELPELLNIIKGEMAIIGPRPLACSYLQYYTEEERHRHDVRPGMTGLAQVNGRNALSWERKFEYDLEYVHTCTLGLDIKIICQTLLKVIKREGIGQGEEAPISLSVERRKPAPAETDNNK
jgi:lipopolysaccharide/colanic/teichoic acid biosynthesis glycosyltransferase